MTLPPFILGTHYRELSPLEGRWKYRFALLRDMRIPLPFRAASFSCHNADGWEWMRIEGGVQTVRAGYWWDGCSPKRYCRILRRWIGTPDSARNIRGSGAHDSLYQASGLHSFPISRKQADELFGDILRADGFRWANLYQGAVDDFGGRSWGQRHRGHYLRML